MRTKRKNLSNIVGIDEDEYQRLVKFHSDQGYLGKWRNSDSVDMAQKIDEPPAEGRGPSYKLDGSFSRATCLAPSIGQLQSLKHLNLRHTRNLTSLPEEIGNLANLQSLTLYDSNIRSLPSSLGQLQSLRDLDLRYTDKLTSLPEEIGNLANLQSLTLRHSAIRSLPSSSGQLQSLKELDLRSTRELTSLPKEFGNLANLQSLNLNYSAITSLPSSIGQLQSLRDLDLSYTDKLTSLPEEIGNLANLQSLILYDSNIRSLPSSSGQLQSLRDLDLRYTRNLTNLPEEIGNLANLQSLDLGSSTIASLPSSIGNLQSLKDLGLSETRIKNLPQEIGSLFNLKKLFLDGLEIIYLPQSIDQLQSLEVIFLTSSHLTSYGPIKRLKDLKWIHLYDSMIPELNSGTDVRAKFLLKLTRLHPHLGHIGVGLDCVKEREIEHALACNRFRFRKSKAPSDCSVWWPYLLDTSNNERLFSEYGSTMGSCDWLQDYERIYILLQYERDSFIETILFARQSNNNN